MNFKKEFSLTGIISIAIAVAAFINNIIVTRQIGVESRGKYAIILNLVMLLSLFLGEGLRKSNTILVADKQNKLKDFLSLNFVALLTIFIIFIVVLNLPKIRTRFFPNITSLQFLFGLIITILTIGWQGIQALFLGERKIKYYNNIQAIPVFVTLLINIIGIYLFGFVLNEILLVVLISSFLSFSYGLYVYRSQIKGIVQINIQLLKQSFMLSTRSTFVAIFFFILIRGDIFLINYFLGSVAVGLYSIAVLFVDVAQRVPNFLGPLFISRTLNDDYTSSVINAVKLTRVLFAFNLILALVLLISAHLIIKFLFGEDFYGSITSLLYLLPAIVFFGSGSIIHSFYIGQSYPTFTIINNFFAGTLNLGLNILLIPRYGIAAAALVSSFTYFLWMFFYIMYFKHLTGNGFREMLILRKSDIKYFFNNKKNSR